MKKNLLLTSLLLLSIAVTHSLCLAGDHNPDVFKKDQRERFQACEIALFTSLKNKMLNIIRQHEENRQGIMEHIADVYRDYDLDIPAGLQNLAINEDFLVESKFRIETNHDNATSFKNYLETYLMLRDPGSADPYLDSIGHWQSWESFTLEDPASRRVLRLENAIGRWVFIKGYNDWYLSAHQDTGVMSATKNRDFWEMFYIQNAPGDKYFIRTVHGGYLSYSEHGNLFFSYKPQITERMPVPVGFYGIDDGRPGAWHFYNDSWSLVPNVERMNCLGGFCQVRNVPLDHFRAMEVGRQHTGTEFHGLIEQYDRPEVYYIYGGAYCHVTSPDQVARFVGGYSQVKRVPNANALIKNLRFDGWCPG